MEDTQDINMCYLNGVLADCGGAGLIVESSPMGIGLAIVSLHDQ